MYCHIQKYILYIVTLTMYRSTSIYSIYFYIQKYIKKNFNVLPYIEVHTIYSNTYYIQKYFHIQHILLYIAVHLSKKSVNVLLYIEVYAIYGSTSIYRSTSIYSMYFYIWQYIEKFFDVLLYIEVYAIYGSTSIYSKCYYIQYVLLYLVVH